MPKCKEGEYFVKFNFGNSKFSRKFVQITEENIRWSAKKEEIRSGTKGNSYFMQRKWRRWLESSMVR